MKLLSICIPTYNRAELLRYCLQNLRALDAYDISYEIVVLNHASTDHTTDVLAELAQQWENLRIYHQTHQVDIGGQFTACMRLARGKFALYLADDDKLHFDALVDYVNYMQAHDEVSAIYAPWLAYDDDEEKVLHDYFKVEEQVTFTINKPFDLFNYMANKNIFPEIGLYRTSQLHRVKIASMEAAFHAFLRIHAMLKQGDVVFMPKPFYLEVARAKAHIRPPSRLNIEMNMNVVNIHRAGLEVMLMRMFHDTQTVKVPDQFRLQVHEALMRYLHNRLAVELKRAMLRRDYMCASELGQRLMLWHGVYDPQLQQQSNEMYLPAGIQAAAWLCKNMSWMQQCVLFGFNDAEKIRELFLFYYPGFPVLLMNAEEIAALPSPEEVFVLVKTTEQREQFLGTQLLPGAVIALQEMADYYQLFPAKRDITKL